MQLDRRSQNDDLYMDDVLAEYSKTQIAVPKVLCIDDDPNVVEGLARRLERRGVTAIRAYHGMQGYWLACSENPDVIVTDLCMPHGGGAYVVECLKRNHATRSIPIIVLSGIGVTNLQHRIRQLDVENAFTKPASFDSLFRSISALIGSRRTSALRRAGPAQQAVCFE